MKEEPGMSPNACANSVPRSPGAERVRRHRERRRAGRLVVPIELHRHEIAYLIGMVEPTDGDDAAACARALGLLLDRIIPARSSRK